MSTFFLILVYFILGLIFIGLIVFGPLLLLFLRTLVIELYFNYINRKDYGINTIGELFSEAYEEAYDDWFNYGGNPLGFPIISHCVLVYEIIHDILFIVCGIFIWIGKKRFTLFIFRNLLKFIKRVYHYLIKIPFDYIKIPFVYFYNILRKTINKIGSIELK